MIVYLVRHGLSVANVARLVTGKPDDTLNNIGCSQAEHLQQWLVEAQVVPDAFLVSHWQRAQQTAKLLYPQASWEVDERIGETDAGDVANLSLESFLASWPDFYRSPKNRYPGGESHCMLNARVVEFWLELQQRDIKSALVVTHSGPISCILQKTLHIDMGRFPSFLPVNASISILEGEQAAHAKDMNFTLKGFSLGPLSNISKALTGK